MISTDNIQIYEYIQNAGKKIGTPIYEKGRNGKGQTRENDRRGKEGEREKRENGLKGKKQKRERER